GSIDTLVAELKQRFPGLSTSNPTSLSTPVPVTITNPLPLSVPQAPAPILGGTAEAQTASGAISATAVSMTAQTVQLAGPVSITVNLPGMPSQTVQAQLYASQQNTVEGNL